MDEVNRISRKLGQQHFNDVASPKSRPDFKRRGSLLGYGTRGYLETPSVSRSNTGRGSKKSGGRIGGRIDDSTASSNSRSLLQRSRSTLSLIDDTMFTPRSNLPLTMMANHVNVHSDVNVNEKEAGKVLHTGGSMKQLLAAGNMNENRRNKSAGRLQLRVNINKLTPKLKSKTRDVTTASMAAGKKSNKTAKINSHNSHNSHIAHNSHTRSVHTGGADKKLQSAQILQSARIQSPTRTSTLSSISNDLVGEPLINSCTSTSVPSFECDMVLNETWPQIYKLYQFVYVLMWEGLIYGGLNKYKQFWIFNEPLPFPSFGMPANTIIPVPQGLSHQKEFESLRLDANAVLPNNWFRLQPFTSYPGLLERLMSWWKKLTNQCIGPICATNHVLDLLTGRCLSRTLLLEPVKETGFERITSTIQVVSDEKRAHLKWKLLDSFLLYRTAVSSPQVELLGVVYKPVDGDIVSKISVFPYPIPLSTREEFNEETFGLPEPYLSTLVNMLSQANTNLHVLTMEETNNTLLQMQQQMGDFIVIPNTCLFETALDKPGVYIMRDSSCYQMKGNDTKRNSKLNKANVNDDSETFVAYLAERDSRYKDNVNVLAGFNSQMQLIVPEYPLSIPISDTTKIISRPVSFDKLMQPFVYDRLTDDTLEKLNQNTFLQRLNGGH